MFTNWVHCPVQALGFQTQPQCLSTSFECLPKAVMTYRPEISSESKIMTFPCAHPSLPSPTSSLSPSSLHHLLSARSHDPLCWPLSFCPPLYLPQHRTPLHTSPINIQPTTSVPSSNPHCLYLLTHHHDSFMALLDYESILHWTVFILHLIFSYFIHSFVFLRWIYNLFWLKGIFLCFVNRRLPTTV